MRENLIKVIDKLIRPAYPDITGYYVSAWPEKTYTVYIEGIRDDQVASKITKEIKTLFKMLGPKRSEDLVIKFRK